MVCLLCLLIALLGKTDLHDTSLKPVGIYSKLTLWIWSEDFFQGDYLHKDITTTILTLILKVEKPKSLADYRPISLASFASKLISKIIASRVSKILPIVINEQQYGFVQGRSIHESISLTQEMVLDLDRMVDGGNMILKFDMSKAYDRLECRFLLRALRAMGFSDRFQDIVYRTICNVWYKVTVNGFLSTKFRSTRGVRQGDPLSPLLFILAQQILSFNLKRLEISGSISAYKLGHNT